MTIAEKEEIRAFLTLNRLRIEGRRRAVALLSEGKSAREAETLMESEDLFKDIAGAGSAFSFNVEKEMETCAQSGIGFLLFSDRDYPAILKEISDPPLLLYKKGTLLEEDRNAIAIVGTRHPSFYGRIQAKRFAQELAARGLTIVSGLARGIDQVAHEGALCVSYGRTIAVMGCGMDVIYPKEHESLFRRISERGVILSEYPLGTPPLPENFPRRNRILSGLAYATFVVEAHSRSGSLITAHQAVEQGREVFALPGPVDQLTSRGTHQLIKEGACLVETAEDIILALADRLNFENKIDPVFDGQPATPELLSRVSSLSKTDEDNQALFPDENTPAPFIANKDNSVIEELLKEEGPLAQDEILEFTGLEPSKLTALLLSLELAKKIKRGVDGKYGLSG